MTDRGLPPEDPAPGDANRADAALAREAATLLRQSAEDIDAGTASRLNRARQAALEQSPRARQRAPWRTPAWTVAAVAVLAVGLWLNQGGGPESPAPGTPVVESAADMDLLLADDNLEMLEELEFYAWLDGEMSAADAGSAG